MEEFLVEANNRIDKALAHLRRELATIRAGRANPSLIEEIPVMAYGTKMKLMEVGTITSPQPTLLTVQVWDASLVQDVQKAIMEANIGLNPSVDGQTVRLPIPSLNEERRQEFVKMAHQRAEEARVEVRQIRQDARSQYESEQKNGDYGEDEQERREKLLQHLIDQATGTIEELVKEKEADLMTV